MMNILYSLSKRKANERTKIAKCDQNTGTNVCAINTFQNEGRPIQRLNGSFNGSFIICLGNPSTKK